MVFILENIMFEIVYKVGLNATYKKAKTKELADL